MAKPGIITPEARKFITENCSLTSPELKQLLHDKFGVDASEVGIWEHMKVARRKAEEATRAADAHISHTIAERVAGYIPKILSRYEKELERIERILDGNDTEFQLKLDDDGTRDKYWATKYAKLYDDLASSYMALRPPIQTVRVESAVNPDVALMDTWSEKKLKAYEKFLNVLEEESNQVDEQ